MGGCCCHSVRRTASDGAQVYSYHPQDLVENGHFSSPHGLPSAVPLLVNSNSHTSIPDAYREPSRLSLRESSMHIQSTTGSTENIDNKNEHKQPIATLPARYSDGGDIFEGSDMANGLKEMESMSISDCESSSPKVMEKLSNLDSSILDSSIIFVADEDVCPTCLEVYDAENPRIITRCRHHFHLSCILEWFERSNTCAICDRIMEVDNIALFGQTW